MNIPTHIIAMLRLTALNFETFYLFIGNHKQTYMYIEKYYKITLAFKRALSASITNPLQMLKIIVNHYQALQCIHNAFQIS